MAAIKPGLLLNEGPALSGEVFVAEIGIPAFLLEKATRGGSSGHQTDVADILSRLPHRDQNAHKYSSGTLAVIAGSPGLTGAPVLASEAGLRVGSGAVILATRNSVRETIERKVIEIMTIGLPEDPDGIPAEDALFALESTLKKANAIVLGCGLGREEKTSSFVHRLLASWDGPAVVDADALFALSGNPNFVLEHSKGRWVLTPHQGEFERILSSSVNWTDRASLANRFSDEWNCILVLKGNPTVIGIPGEPTVFSGTGNALLATAGTGDVLAGMIGGYLAQGLKPADAAIVGTFVGGLIADRYLADLGTSTMIASDLIHEIPTVLSKLVHGQIPDTPNFFRSVASSDQ
jgi:NAD(P)H-hydrate epimerase